MLSKNPQSEMLTIGAISAEIHVPWYRVSYVIKTRGIKPSLVAGRYRIFDQAAVERIRAEIKKMSRRGREEQS